MSAPISPAHPVRDAVRTALQDGWNRFDRMMEDTQLLGSAAEFAPWDGLKRAASDAMKEGRKDVQVLRTRAAQASKAFINPCPSLSTPTLSRDASLHSHFAKQYLTYAELDAKEAARQAGIVCREVFEVGRRRVGGEDPTHARPTVFKSLESRLIQPNGYPSSAVIAAADAALLGIGVDLGVGMGIGAASSRWARERREKREREREKKERDIVRGR